MSPAIIIYLLLSLVPSFLTLLYSFTDISKSGTTWHFIGLENYRRLFFVQNTRDILGSIGRTFYFAFAVTVIQNIFALLLAVLFNSKVLRGRNLYRSLVFLPYVLGVTVCCYTWVLMMGIDGPVFELLDVFKIKSGLLSSERDALKVVVLIHVWITAGYAMVLDIAGLQGIPQELYEAASIDGSSPVSSFFRITVPLLWSTLSINILLSIIGALGSVQTILLTTGGANKTDTLAIRIYQSAFALGARNPAIINPTKGYAAAQSIVLFVITLFFALLVFYLTRMRGKKYED